MKNFYENPEMEIVLFSVEDVIATSAGISDRVGEDNGGFGSLQ